MTKSVWDTVIEDMKGRDQFGTKKYGKPLFIHDGRDTLQDAYEEALDLVVYLKKAIMERASANNPSAQRQDLHQGSMPEEGAIPDSQACQARGQGNGEGTS